ncbi:MAG: sugar transferase [Gaiellales bacterium]
MKHRERRADGIDRLLKRQLDLLVSCLIGLLSIPVVVIVAAAIKLDSRGPVFYRCQRVGHLGRTFGMLKFRKMRDGSVGACLTAHDDERFTRVGRLLARTKLDELPQLWNVITGQMSLVGPRPEDPGFVESRPEFETILAMKPGITGLSQLAFANESKILAQDDPITDYVDRILPQKIALDCLYADRRSVAMDVRVLLWTAVAVVLRKDIAVHRDTGHQGIRRRPRTELAGVGSPLQPETES